MRGWLPPGGRLPGRLATASYLPIKSFLLSLCTLPCGVVFLSAPRPSHPFPADRGLTTPPTCKIPSFPLMWGRAVEGQRTRE